MLTRSIQLKQPLTKKQTGLWPDVVHPLQDLAWLQFCTLPSCFKTGMVTCSSFYHSGPGLSTTTWREISFPEYLDMKKLDQVRQEATEYCWRIKSTISSGRKSEVPWYWYAATEEGSVWGSWFLLLHLRVYDFISKDIRLEVGWQRS